MSNNQLPTDIASFRVGTTLNGKYIFCPTRPEYLTSFLDYLFDDFDHFDLFDSYALYEHLIQRELTKKVSDKHYFSIFEEVSDRLFQYLAINGYLNEMMYFLKLPTSIDICRYGSRLCLLV